MNEAQRAWLAAWIDPVRAALALARPIVNLLVRLALAQLFLVSGMMSLAGRNDALWPALARFLGVGLDPAAAAMLGSTIEVAAAMLLAVGFLGRPAALVLLGLTLLAEVDGLHHDGNLFRAAVFAGYVVFGAGPLSLDHLLAKGLAQSALPFARAAIGAGQWVAARIGPVFQLALRLWLAASLTVPLLPPTWFVVRTADMLPVTAAWPAALLLAAGFAMPLVAGIGAIFGFSDWMMMSGSPAVADGALLLALLAVRGAGTLSLDGLVLRLLAQPAMPRDTDPHIVIVGAGFGGIACAAGLRHEKVRVTLVDRRNYHLFQPLLYQVATASLSPADIATPIRALFRDDPRVTVLCGAVSAVDPARRTVRVDDRDLSYDMLVLATGATHSYFGNEHWAAHAPGLKFVEDAVAIRGRVLAAFENAEATDDAAEREAFLTFVVCGGGPTGVELAGAIAELARHGLEKEFRRFDPAAARVILVQSGPRLLPQLPDSLSETARLSLVRLGVEVRLNSRVKAVDADGVMVGEERIAAATVLWAAGVVASAAAQWVGAAADSAGRIQVLPDLSIGDGTVFAIGDTAAVAAWRGKPVPALAPAAKQQGAYVARVVHARLAGRRPPPPFAYRHQGTLATIGRQSAVADLGWLKVSGGVAWWIWGTVHILFLLSVRNRISVLVGWAWSYVTYGVSARMITGEASSHLGRRRSGMEAAPE